MIKGITYADEKMTKSQDVCMESMGAVGFNVIRGYGPSWFNDDDTFVWLNKNTLSQARGCGYWLWKPWCIAHAMSDMKDGDILVYSDAGVKWIASAQHIIDVMDGDLFLFSNGHQHVHWCKMDVVESINLRDCQEVIKWKKYPEQQQAQASVIFIRVSEFSRRFIKEWLLWCQMPGFIDDSPSVLPNHPEFAEHRHDQAILTCMAIKYGIKLHWWADHLWYESQRYRWPDDKYPSMFEHHRKRNNEWTS